MLNNFFLFCIILIIAFSIAFSLGNISFEYHKAKEKRKKRLIVIIGILLTLVFDIFVIVIFSSNPGWAYEDHKTEVKIDITEFPNQEVSEDIDKFFELCKNYEITQEDYHVYFEKSVKDSNVIFAIFETKDAKEIVEIKNLYMLEYYRSKAWKYDKNKT